MKSFKIKNKKQIIPWSGIDKNFNPLGYEGFVYLITNKKTDKKYIGKKNFFRGRPNKRNRKESDWKTYYSSSEDVQSDINKLGIKAFKFEIISLHKKRSQTNYYELKEQIVRDVLLSRLPDGEYEYYNGNIARRYFRGNIQ